MVKRINACLVFIFIINTISLAQIFPKKNYPVGYFSWPVNAKKGLVANFGELRTNRYHMGLDCRTDQKENRPVLAAADGYVAKIKIEPFGFGRCIYINHPNGLTTVYAHLNDFYPELEKYVTAQQYKLQSWNIFLEDIPPGLITVKKGQFIAYSGSTGGSQGPHTHFEIRDTKTDKVLNPLLFGLPVLDNIPPDILRLAVYDRNISTFEQAPKLYPVRKANGIYTITPRVLLTNAGRVSFAITAFDRYSGSTNKNGIYQAVLYEDEQPVCGFQLDSISYDETRYLNAHTDYKLHSGGGSWVQHLSRLPGYPEGVYKDISGDGVINIEDGAVHHLKIEVKDVYGNTSSLQFDVLRSPAKAEQPGSFLSVNRQNEFLPGYLNVYETSDVSFYLPENALYDSIRFTYKAMMSTNGYPVYQLHNGNIPVHCRFPIRIRYPGSSNSDKMVMHRSWKDKNDYEKAVPVRMGAENNWYEASFREFGNFQLVKDTIPPSIVPVGIRDGMNAAKLTRIAFVIKDNTENLENFTAYLDGKWIRFSNDKGSEFIYKFDEHCPAGSHELKIGVEDCVGNRSERTYHFTR